MNDDEREKRLKRLADKLPELDAIVRKHALVSRKLREANELAERDEIRAIQIVMQWCEQDKELAKAFVKYQRDLFLAIWDEEGEEQN